MPWKPSQPAIASQTDFVPDAARVGVTKNRLVGVKVIDLGVGYLELEGSRLGRSFQL